MSDGLVGVLSAVTSTGVAVLGFLWRLDARMGAMEHCLNSHIDSPRQELRTDISALHARIDSLYQYSLPPQRPCGLSSRHIRPPLLSGAALSD